MATGKGSGKAIGEGEARERTGRKARSARRSSQVSQALRVDHGSRL
jgi:hypothetical protein